MEEEEGRKEEEGMWRMTRKEDIDIFPTHLILNRRHVAIITQFSQWFTCRHVATLPRTIVLLRHFSTLTELRNK